MPDLQSELAKLNAVLPTFDDPGEPEVPLPPAESAAREDSMTARIISYVLDWPRSTSLEVHEGTGITKARTSTLLAQLHKQGRVTRVRDKATNMFRYSVGSIQLAHEPQNEPGVSQASVGEFNPDHILSALNVLEAKQLLTKLKELFEV